MKPRAHIAHQIGEIAADVAQLHGVGHRRSLKYLGGSISCRLVPLTVINPPIMALYALGLGLEIFGRQQPSLPNRGVSGPLGEASVPGGKFTQRAHKLRVSRRGLKLTKINR